MSTTQEPWNEHEHAHPQAGWLTREHLLSLARRCHLRADLDLLAALTREGFLPMLTTEGGRRYAPAHLWLLARYLDLTASWRHPWGEDTAPTTDPQALQQLRDDARDLNAALAWWAVREQSLAPAPEVAREVARRMERFAHDRSPLGPLRQLVPLLHGAARAGLRGDALLTELVGDQARRLLDFRPAASAEPTAPEADLYATVALPPVPAEHPVDVNTDAAQRSSDEPALALARAAEAASQSQRKARSPGLEGFQSPQVNKDGGLKEALARAREATQRRARLPSAAELRAAEAEPPRAEPELPEATSQPEPPQTPSKANLSLEEQVRELNQRRDEYIKERKWDRLVQLYTERIYLFPRAQERRQIFSNVGAIYEQKLKQPEQAIDAWRQAFDAEPGDNDAFLALQRLYRRAGRWGDLLSLIDDMIAARQGAPEQTTFRIQRARLLGTRLAQSDDALLVCRDLLASELSTEHRDMALEALQRIAREDHCGADALLSIATLLEAHWSSPRHVDPLLDLYERLFSALQHRDPIAAAEVMSRQAATLQANDRHHDAFVSLSRAFSSNPDREDLADRLEALADRLNAHHELASFYEEEFSRALGSSPRALIARRLAALYERLHDHEGLRRAWMTISEADPFDINALQKLAALQRQHGQWEDLIETLGLLREQLQGQPRVEVLLQLAHLRAQGLLDPNSPVARLADPDDAFSHLQEALSSVRYGNPDADLVVAFTRELIEHSQPALAFQLGELLEPFLAGSDAHAALIDLYELLVSFHMTTVDGATEAARLLLRAGQLQELRLQQPALAMAWYTRALRVDPQCEGALDHLLALAERLQQWEEVAALLEESLDNTRISHREPWLRHLAHIYDRRLRQEDAALPWYEALLELSPADPEALDFLEDYAQRHQHWPRLIELLEARAAAEGAVVARKELLSRCAALCLEHLGDEPRALTLLRQALTIQPDDPALLQRLVALYRGAERWSDLEEFLARQEELSLDPDTQATVMLERAQVLADRLHQRAQALAVLERLKALRPDDPAVLQRLSALYAEHGHSRDAAAALRERAALLAREDQTDALADALEQLVALYHTHPPDAQEQARAAEHLLTLRPDHLSALSLLERAYEDQQRWLPLARALKRHARLMIARKERAAAEVLIDRVLELAQDQLKDPALELEALNALAQLSPPQPLPQIERRLELARSLQDWRAHLQANEELISILDDPNDHVEILLEMAHTAREHLAEPSIALNYLDRALDAQPQHRAALEASAALLRQTRQYPRLADTLRRLLALEGGFTPAQTVALQRDLAEVSERHLNTPQDAIDILRHSVQLIDRFGEVVPSELQQQIHRRLANLHQRLGQEELSLDHLEELQRSLVESDESGESVARLCEEMGQLALSLGHLDEAERHFRTAIAENTDFAEAQLGLATTYTRMARWDAALELLEPLTREINKIDSAVERGRAFAALARALAATGQPERAREAFQRALQHDPRNTDARDALR